MDVRRSDVDSATTPTRQRQSWRNSVRTLNTTTRPLFYSGVLTAPRVSTVRRRSNAHQIDNDVDPNQMALLVKEKWELSRVTPMYNFRYTELKAYSKNLSAFLLEEKQQGTAAAVAGYDKVFAVTFSTISGVAKTKDDAETVFIQINSKPVFAAAGDAPKVVWSGWLTCVRAAPQYLQSLPPEFVCLPVFCSSGAQSLTFLVQSWFERTFDCSFGSLDLSPTDLQWLAAIWTSYHNERKIRSLKLKWTLPSEPPLDVTMAVDGQDAWDLWDSTHQQEDANDIYIEHVKRFLNCIETHFYRHFNIHLSAGVLKRVATEGASVHIDGKVKICPEYLPSTMELLTECAILRMPL
ncbi:hypothetical protein ACEWY4_000202 [Coilia grayii]|uniref:Centromere protein L n=1 Tax=Coilia grayii TaxID=363190 RepID=A0ABD1KVZ2_9TELE